MINRARLALYGDYGYDYVSRRLTGRTLYRTGTRTIVNRLLLPLSLTYPLVCTMHLYPFTLYPLVCTMHLYSFTLPVRVTVFTGIF